MDHPFVVVQSLITPVISGIDFMQKHGLVLDFTITPVTIHSKKMSVNCQPDVQPLLNAMKKDKIKVAAVPSISQSTDDTITVQSLSLIQQVMTYPTAVTLPFCLL